MGPNDDSDPARRCGSFQTAFVVCAVTDRHSNLINLAERVGFEPTVGCPTHAFQACAFDRSAISPEISEIRTAVLPCRVCKEGAAPPVGYREFRLGDTRGRDLLADRCGFSISDTQIVGLPGVGGLQHRYTWREAARSHLPIPRLTKSREAGRILRTDGAEARASLSCLPG